MAIASDDDDGCIKCCSFFIRSTMTIFFPTDSKLFIIVGAGDVDMSFCSGGVRGAFSDWFHISVLVWESKFSIPTKSTFGLTSKGSPSFTCLALQPLPHSRSSLLIQSFLATTVFQNWHWRDNLFLLWQTMIHGGMELNEMHDGISELGSRRQDRLEML
ncbi:hypothetical protein NE237_030636 [Protea cynaroides]|uniref:Uncharacterized protein n=1 Tax=Protea cynaroides TaxID=273540 RepID=A0A9Q0GUH1_9MAGN|nr:hypothetical protein NE237_030636 [Protea cynaroides]